MPAARIIIKTVFAGVFGASSALIFNEQVLSRKKLKASWTTHHNTPEPLYKWDDNWDMRKPVKKVDVDESGDKVCEVQKPTATRHIFLIRHGQYNMDGDTDEARILTALGRQQASLTGQRLKSLNLPFNRIVYSTMARAQETGRIISEQLSADMPVEHCSMLREGAPIPPEPPAGSWTPEARFYEDGARIEAAFRKYFHRASVNQKETSHEILVCHANVIRYFACRALQLPPEAWLRMSLHNGSITWLVIRPSGNVSIRALGDFGFMDKDLMTTT